jgi:hypothetical protein
VRFHPLLTRIRAIRGSRRALACKQIVRRLPAASPITPVPNRLRAFHGKLLVRPTLPASINKIKMMPTPIRVSSVRSKTSAKRMRNPALSKVEGRLRGFSAPSVAVLRDLCVQKLVPMVLHPDIALLCNRTRGGRYSYPLIRIRKHANLLTLLSVNYPFVNYPVIGRFPD